MKFFVGLVSFAIALWVGTSLSQKETGTLACWNNIDKLLADISIDITVALGGEVNDLVTGNCPLFNELEDVISQLQAIKLELPIKFRVNAERVYLGLKQLNEDLKKIWFHYSPSTIAIYCRS